ncbi:hypothetical protein C8Q78DRAFT_606827 [Trametes maxima]|nr:hypothetical protein C8Q78DRAFT_606827 [Trametes maxima]
MVESTLTQRQTTLPNHTPDDWLACDRDVETSIFLLVEPARCCGSRWSLVWRVGGSTESEMTAWRSHPLQSIGRLRGATRVCILRAHDEDYDRTGNAIHATSKRTSCYTRKY